MSPGQGRWGFIFKKMQFDAGMPFQPVPGFGQEIHGTVGSDEVPRDADA